MKKIKELIQKNSKTTKGKAILSFISVVLLYILYSVYAWFNSESTDNAYIDGDITFISPEVPGIITEVNFVENQLVKKGDVLAKIKDIDYKVKYDQASSQLEAGKIAISIIEQKIELSKIDLSMAEDKANLAKINFDTTTREYSRIAKLTKGNYTSQKILDDSTLAMKQAQSNNNSANLNLDSAKKNLDLLESQKQSQIITNMGLEDSVKLAGNALAYTNLISPFDGVVTSSSARLGGYATPGYKIFAIVPKGKFYVRANFKETQVGNLREGMKASLYIDALGGKRFDATIRNLYPATGANFALIPTDNATGNFTKIVQRLPVILDIEASEEDKQRIAIGYSVYVTVRTDQ